MAVAITATEQTTVWPSRIVVSVTGLTLSDSVAIYRRVGATRTLLRGSFTYSTTTTAYAVTDAEQPFGVPVYYTVQVNGTDVISTSPATYTLEGGKVALSDAIGQLSAEVVILAWPSRRTERKGTVFALTDSLGVGYTSPVFGAAGQFSGQVELFTDTATGRDSVITLLKNATGGTVQLRVPDASTYVGFDSYLAVTGWDEVMFSQDGNDPRRRWQLDIAEVPGWADAFEAPGWTYDDWSDAYPSSTYTAVSGVYATYLAAAIADIGAL